MTIPIHCDGDIAPWTDRTPCPVAAGRNRVPSRSTRTAGTTWLAMRPIEGIVASVRDRRGRPPDMVLLTVPAHATRTARSPSGDPRADLVVPGRLGGERRAHRGRPSGPRDPADGAGWHRSAVATGQRTSGAVGSFGSSCPQLPAHQSLGTIIRRRVPTTPAVRRTAHLPRAASRSARRFVATSPAHGR